MSRTTTRARTWMLAAVVVAVLATGCESPGAHDAVSGHVSGRLATRAATASPTMTPAASTAPLIRHPQLLNPKHKYFGVAVPGFPSELSALQTAVSQVGQRPKVVEYFQDWTHDFASSQLLPACNAGETPLLTWESWSWEDVKDGGTAFKQPAYAPRKITAGKYDRYIRRYAASVAALHCTIMLRLDQEPNGHWYPWGVGTKGMHNTPAQYVAMWRHVWRVFQQAGAHNVVWVWSPNYLYKGAIDKLDELYPGDKYVDLVGIDGYLIKKSTTPAKIFGPVMSRLSIIAGSKPWLIAETAANAGPKQPEQIKEIFSYVAASAHLIGLVYLDQVTSRANWPFSALPASIRAFRRGIALPAFGGHHR